MTVDENDPRNLLIATPVSRMSVACNEIAVTTVGRACAACAGRACDVDRHRRSQVPLGIGDALAGALNTGRSRGFRPAPEKFVLNVTQSTGRPDWVANLSPLAHLAAVPHAPPELVAVAAMAAVGAFLLASGLVGSSRRDLTTPPSRP